MSLHTTFNPQGTPANVSASTTHAEGTIGSSGGPGLRIHNQSTTSIAYIRWGPAATVGVAVATDLSLAPGSIEVFSVPVTADTVSILLASGTATVQCTRGEGL